MKVEYVGHACLSVETADLKIVFDPWLVGPAYCGQWNIFPKPVNDRVLEGCPVVMFSHGHEDHFHPPTVERMDRQTRLFFPYTWHGSTVPYLRQLGFQHATEAATGQRLQLSPGTAATYVVNNLDSVIVIESGGQVLVDVNDALHSYPPKIVDVFLRHLRARWPRIDAVFCGFGGASYFPNAIHCPGKNDVEIADAREQLFVHAFCRIVHELRPAVAVPFAADYALLRPSQRWINQRRFPRARIADYYHEVYGADPDGPRIFAMYPGDRLLGSQLQPDSPYRAQMRSESLNHLIAEQYKKEISALESTRSLTESEIATLEQEIIANLMLRARHLNPQALEQVEFTLKVPEIRENPYFIINMQAQEPRIQRAAAASQASLLQVEVPSEILRYSFGSEWGGDAITIGYGCEVQIFRPEILASALDVVCVQLLTRTPSATRHWKSEPFRMARFVLTSPATRKWTAQAAWNRIRRRERFPGDYNARLRPWLTRTKCEVCRACDLPLLDDRFASTLGGGSSGAPPHAE
ncbi:MAG: MBL fold metallo-hydrolase [Terriglobales bacterium]